MISWFQSIDEGLLRFINHSLSNSVFDVLMPWLSGNAAFVPLVAVALIALLWRGGLRGRVCVFLLVLGVGLTDGVVCKNLKKAAARPRPFLTHPEVTTRVGRGESGSLPSSHAANWAAAVIVLGAFYRRSWRATVPVALAISFSRVYNGVHYPSDVLAGWALGGGTAWLSLHGAERLWRWGANRWFPLWQHKLPSLLNPVPVAPAIPAEAAPREEMDRHWLRLGYLAIFVMLISRWIYIASGTIELSEDEAYQWTWSKHLALSYFSKPLMIALTQFTGTALWGDNAFGVRFFSPLISAVLGWAMMRFFAREINARAGFILLMVANAAPLMVAGSVLMTIDPLNVLFWMLAMMSGWRALNENRTSQWAWTGLWMGLGFLSKYTAMMQWACWALVFILWPQARARLREKGPWLALAINLVCTTPVIIWNMQHNWITVTHVASNGGLNKAWKFNPKFFLEFTGAEWGLLNPVFAVATFLAACWFWPRRRKNPLLLYLFCMGAPVFMFYWLYTIRYRVLVNWIAPSALPLLALMVAYWEESWRRGARKVKGWMWGGLILGWSLTLLALVPALLFKMPYFPPNARLDPLRRLRAWSETARVIDTARQKLQAEGKPAFIITDHYGIAGHCSFYLPEARAAIKQEAMVYFRTTDTPENQFFFWKGYTERKGQNAIYVEEHNAPDPPNPRIIQQFETVEDLGIFEVKYKGLVYRRVQLWACRNLK